MQQKKEMDEYLTQLEAEGQTEAVYGKDVQLIMPEPWFVVKTKDTGGKNRVYINICTSPKVRIKWRLAATLQSWQTISLKFHPAMISQFLCTLK